MYIWRAVSGVVVALILTWTAGAQSTFTLKVHTGRGQIGYDVNSTMIIGERDILLIDPQFSLAHAQSGFIAREAEAEEGFLQDVQIAGDRRPCHSGFPGDVGDINRVPVKKGGQRQKPGKSR